MIKLILKFFIGLFDFLKPKTNNKQINFENKRFQHIKENCANTIEYSHNTKDLDKIRKQASE